MDGEGATAPEDVSKWTVDDVCSFVGGLSGCREYAPVRGPAQDGLSTPATQCCFPPQVSPQRLRGWGMHQCPQSVRAVSASASKVGHVPNTQETFI